MFKPGGNQRTIAGCAIRITVAARFLNDARKIISRPIRSPNPRDHARV